MATRMNGQEWPGRGYMKHPWDEWLDGSMWQITPGEDFTCTTNAFRRQAYQCAIRRGGNARSTMAPDGHLFLQFIPKER